MLYTGKREACGEAGPVSLSDLIHGMLARQQYRSSLTSLDPHSLGYSLYSHLGVKTVADSGISFSKRVYRHVPSLETPDMNRMNPQSPHLPPKQTTEAYAPCETEHRKKQYSPFQIE